MQDLNDLYYFAMVVDHGGFAAAERALGIPKSRLSRRISQLENELGVRLLQRSTRRFAVTDVGQSVHRHAQSMLAEATAAREVVDRLSAEPRGAVKVSVPVGIAQQLMPKLLPEFLARYPEVHVELYQEAAFADLIAGGFDAGIRLGESLQRDMVAVPIGPRMRQVVVGAPAYFERRGVPRTPQELIAHECIGFRKASGRLYAWEFTDPRRLSGKRDFDIHVEGRLVFNDSALARRAAIDGLGLAQLFEWEVAGDLAAGRLRRVLDDWLQPFDGWYIYYPAREQMAPKLRVFIDFMREPG